VSFVISVSQGINLGHIFRVNVRDLSWHNLTVVPIGALLPLLWTSSPAAMILIIVPLIVVRESLRISADLRRQTREALIGLADTIDLRDPSTYRHSQRVAELSRQIARHMRLNEEQVDLIGFSARLHDLGKIGMSNTLLFKPGAFTTEEQEEFRQHPAIGASMVAGFILFSEGCDLILHHHEAWDGTGYPEGLKGDSISVGSQIISLADAYEAMTSDRPYRGSMSTREAMIEVAAKRGAQFSPRVVDALLEILNKEEPASEDDGGGPNRSEQNGNGS
jgi:HD-GYP domain-containing protein (c-di-GMP phosphodiesterase class II)